MTSPVLLDPLDALDFRLRMRAHAVNRLRERFGIRLSNYGYDKLVAQVAVGAHRLVGEGPVSGQRVHEVVMHGRSVHAVWRDGAIVTFTVGVPEGAAFRPAEPPGRDTAMAAAFERAVAR